MPRKKTIDKAYLIQLRKRGYTLGAITQRSCLPKTTVYHHIKHVPLPSRIQKRILHAAAARITAFNKTRRGVSTEPIRMTLPETWDRNLVFLCGHLLFDGHITTHSIAYTNRSTALIGAVRNAIARYIPRARIKIRRDRSGVYKLYVHNIDVARIFLKKTQQILQDIKKMSPELRNTFLRTFFDDEGSVYWIHKKRLVRGYQHSYTRLRLIKILLRKEGIASTINNTNQEITISRRLNLRRFQEQINFSPGVAINPDRSNSIWKRPLDKRRILEMALASYTNLMMPPPSISSPL